MLLQAAYRAPTGRLQGTSYRALAGRPQVAYTAPTGLLQGSYSAPTGLLHGSYSSLGMVSLTKTSLPLTLAFRATNPSNILLTFCPFYVRRAAKMNAWAT